MHLYSSASLSVLGGLVARGFGLKRIRLTVHYGLIDRGAEGLCLVDTGYGPAVTDGRDRSRAIRMHTALLRPKLIASGQPEAVLAALGRTHDDVAAIVITHFHADHIANLKAFPRARIIGSGAALDRLEAMGAVRAALHGFNRDLLPADIRGRFSAIEGLPLKPTWTRLDLGHDIFGDASYLAVPLPGHALGHHGLVWREAGRPICYAADATWSREALVENRAVRLARALVFANAAEGKATETRLRAFLAEGGDVRLCHEIQSAEAL